MILMTYDITVILNREGLHVPTPCWLENEQPEDVKAEVYEALALINRGFQQVIEGLIRLQKRGVLDEDYVFTQQHITSALSAKINCHILASVTAREEDDRKHYTKMSVSLDKRNRR
jgi:hypothetical protein